MRISVAKTGPLRHRGFTLVEVLVIVVILALVSSVVLVSLPDEDRQAANGAARSVVSLGRQLSVAAVTDGMPRGFDLVDGVPRAYRFTEGTWAPIEGWIERDRFDDVTVNLRPTDEFALPAEDLTDTIEVFDERDLAPAPPSAPRVVFSPVGEATPFVLRIEAGREVRMVGGSGLGDLEVSDASD